MKTTFTRENSYVRRRSYHLCLLDVYLKSEKFFPKGENILSLNAICWKVLYKKKTEPKLRLFVSLKWQQIMIYCNIRDHTCLYLLSIHQIHTPLELTELFSFLQISSLYDMDALMKVLQQDVTWETMTLSGLEST